MIGVPAIRLPDARLPLQASFIAGVVFSAWQLSSHESAGLPRPLILAALVMLGLLALSLPPASAASASESSAVSESPSA